MNGDPTPTPPSAASQATAREFIAVIFRRKWVVLGLFLVVTSTVVVMMFAKPVDYASYGHLLVKRGEQESALSPGRPMKNWEEDLATEAQVVTSWTVRRRAQELLDEQAKRGAPQIRLRAGDVDVKIIGQSNVIEIGYVDRLPEVAHLSCQAVMDAYVEYRSSSESLPYPKAFFDGEMSRVLAASDSIARVRRDYARSENVFDVGEQRRSSLMLRQDLIRDRMQAVASLADDKASLAVIQKLRENPETDIPIAGAGFLNEDALRELKRSMIQQETHIAQLRERYRDDAPELIDARTTLESMKGLLKREVEQRLQLAQARVEGLKARIAAIDRQIAVIDGDLEQTPAKERRMTELDNEQSVLKSRYLELVKNSDQAKVTEQTSRRVSVVVLTPASGGQARNSRDYVRLALAPALSLLVGIGLAFFVDGLDTRLRTAGDLEDTLDVPVLASLNERKS